MTQTPRNQSEEKISLALGRALESIYVKTHIMGFNELVESYKEIESSFLPKVAGNEFLTLEVKRRVLELTLYSAIEKQCSYELCESIFDEFSQLGFTNLEKKSNVYLIFSRYCLDIGRKEEEIRLLQHLEIELKDELCRNKLPVYQELLQTVRDLLKEHKL